MIAIIDTGAKNIGSILNALRYLNIKNELVQKPKDLKRKFTHIILPGVGNFEKVIKTLSKKGFNKKTLTQIAQQKKLLAICVGFQILFTESEESKHKGINLFKGSFKDLKKLGCQDNVPHVGFNSIKLKFKNEIEYLNKKDFYFIHKFALDEKQVNFDNKKILVGKTTHGKTTFISIIISKNLIATQFHPEKSGLPGIKLFKYFYGKKKSYI
tara:strand:+ start:186 stop:821 length:636 start_codon:yes stop_codon:yes gene_type:complete